MRQNEVSSVHRPENDELESGISTYPTVVGSNIGQNVFQQGRKICKTSSGFKFCLTQGHQDNRFYSHQRKADNTCGIHNQAPSNIGQNVFQQGRKMYRTSSGFKFCLTHGKQDNRFYAHQRKADNTCGIYNQARSSAQSSLSESRYLPSHKIFHEKEDQRSRNENFNNKPSCQISSNDHNILHGDNIQRPITPEFIVLEPCMEATTLLYTRIPIEAPSQTNFFWTGSIDNIHPTGPSESSVHNPGQHTTTLLYSRTIPEASDRNNLWTELFYHNLSKVIGTEEVIKTRRALYMCSDFVEKEDPTTLITSGSKGEGLDFQDSDLDVMSVLTDIKVFQRTSDAEREECHLSLIVDTEDAHPGFAKLKLHSTKDEKLVDLWFTGENPKYLSNVLFKSNFNIEILPIVHGPCLSDTRDIFDVAYVLHCKDWITKAQPWVYRLRQDWPRSDTVINILSYGILFVAIGCKESENEEIEWRMSFSVAEKQLIYSFNHTQLLCYAILKIILKEINRKHKNIENLLCSYFMKTVLFWISEESPLSIWEPLSLMSNTLKCMQRLMYCVKHSTLPNYFIPENNMFENRFTERNQKELLSILDESCKNATQIVLNSKYIAEFKGELKWRCLVPHRSFSFERDFASTLLYVHNTKPNGEFIDYKRIMRGLLNSRSKLEKEVFLYFLSTVAQQFSQKPMSEENSNKKSYRNYRVRLGHLLVGTHHDAASGWLLIASLFYSLKHYSTSLQIVDYALSKCTPEKFYPRKVLIKKDFDRTLSRPDNIQQQGFLIRNISQLAVDFIGFSKCSSFIPLELLHEVVNKEYTIPPVVFGLVLAFLCGHHLGDFPRCVGAYQYMMATLKNRCFISSRKEIAVAMNCLGVILQMMAPQFEGIENDAMQAVGNASNLAFKTARECEPRHS